MDPGDYPMVLLKVVRGTYSKRTYGFDSPAGLWKVLMRVTVFVIAPVAINALIGFKSVPQVLSFLMNFWKLIYKHHRIFFLLDVLYIYNYHGRFFLWLRLYIYNHHRIFFL